jgi:hypothetical protein
VKSHVTARQVEEALEVGPGLRGGERPRLEGVAHAVERTEGLPPFPGYLRDIETDAFNLFCSLKSHGMHSADMGSTSSRSAGIGLAQARHSP